MDNAALQPRAVTYEIEARCNHCGATVSLETITDRKIDGLLVEVERHTTTTPCSCRPHQED